jgi:phosphatidylserine/phosphatidylglycerophosphate/cardiolipin synthase-like enzyme
MFVITNSNKEGIGSGIVNSYRMLESLGRADTIPEVARQERAEDMKARVNRTRVEAAVIRQRLPNLAFAARQNPRGPLAKQYAEDKERLKALEEQEKAQTQKLNEIQDKKTVIQDEKIPGLKVLVCTLVAPDLPDGQDWNANYVYIHAKLMLIDDTFMTLGSANINTRSMEVDSELNIAHDRYAVTQPLRRRLWGMHTNNRGAQDDPEAAYKAWRQIMDQNKIAQEKNKTPVASLVEFHRDSPDRTDKD